MNIAQLDPNQLVEGLRHDGHPALYYLLLGWWIDAFGDNDSGGALVVRGGFTSHGLGALQHRAPAWTHHSAGNAAACCHFPVPDPLCNRSSDVLRCSPFFVASAGCVRRAGQ